MLKPPTSQICSCLIVKTTDEPASQRYMKKQKAPAAITRTKPSLKFKFTALITSSSYDNSSVARKAWTIGWSSALSSIHLRCFQLRAYFAILHIVEYTNTDKFYLGCILFIQQILLQKHLFYPKAPYTFSHREGRVALGVGHLFSRDV